MMPEQAKLIPEWRTKGGFTMPIGLSERDFARTYSVEAAPTTMLLDAGRKLMFRHVGFDTGAERTLEAEIRELLGLDPFEGQAR